MIVTALALFAGAQEPPQEAFMPIKDDAITGFALSPEDARAAIPGPDGQRFAEAAQRGELTVVLYEPRGEDPQGPHLRDEVYVVVAGEGEFVHGGERVAFTPGDLLFVAAHTPHRFENFTDDFSTWVIFYGEERPEPGAEE